ncbi:MAG: outer membrane lipoprotein carrier protein LolA [Gammaproteobacteria bacterium]|nr:MAG: outer membrane lipoprotein carrier protein LolA [Gammaproteobacteria bacterium]
MRARAPWPVPLPGASLLRAFLWRVCLSFRACLLGLALSGAFLFGGSFLGPAAQAAPRGAGAHGAAAAEEGALARLERFLRRTRSLQATFVQETRDADGGLQRAEGRLLLARPGRFRWEYLRPYRQLVVGDGRRVWVYDPDLAQVTVRPADAALGDTPAALLSGAVDLRERFTIQEAGIRDGLRWLRLRPRRAEGPFRELRLGLDGRGVPVRMVLVDALDQRTLLRLEGVRLGAPVPARRFAFRPPPGVDVVKEGKVP